MPREFSFEDDEVAVLQRVVEEAIETEESFQDWEAKEKGCLGAPVVEVEGAVIMSKQRADSIHYEEQLKHVKAKLERG